MRIIAMILLTYIIVASYMTSNVDGDTGKPVKDQIVLDIAPMH